MDELLNQSLIKATEHVFNSMLGLSLKSSPPVEISITDSQGDTSVLINIVGDISGAITLKFSKSFASKVASQMLGMEVAEGSEEMKDAAGELLNMIVGCAKSYYCSDSDPFKISVPTTVIGEDYRMHIKANPGDTISLIDFNCNSDVLVIEVYVM